MELPFFASSSSLQLLHFLLSVHWETIGDLKYFLRWVAQTSLVLRVSVKDTQPGLVQARAGYLVRDDWDFRGYGS